MLALIKREWGFSAALLVTGLLIPAAATATTIPVDSALDTTGGGVCTLRDAIKAANGNSGFGTCPAGQGSPTVDTIDLSGAGGSPITLTADLPAITSNMDIVGPGSGLLVVDGAGSFRPFRLTSSSFTDSISGITISNGLADNSSVSGAEGAGILNSATLTLTDVNIGSNTASATGGTNAFPEGGGIRNDGILHLVLSVVAGNTASAMNATNQNGPEGGGIWNNGTVTIDRSTVADNHAVATTTGTSTSAVGGGILQFTGSLSISRSTVSGNTVSGTGGTANNSGVGGAIFMSNSMGNTLALDRTTVTANSASAGAPNANQNGGGVWASGGSGSALTVVSSTIGGNSSAGTANLLFGGETQSIKNSIVSNPLGGGVNCGFAGSASLGFNIDSANNCGFSQTGDQHGVDPMLDGLLDNGGPTLTMALLSGSPAIEAGLSSVGETTDQRGLLRPSDQLSVATAPGSNGSDIGAFEVQGQPFPGPPVTTPPTTTSPPTTTVRKKKCKRKKKHKRPAVAAKKKCKKRKHR